MEKLKDCKRIKNNKNEKKGRNKRNKMINAIKQIEYPGRFIVMGKSQSGENIAVYGITGRSAASRARIMEIQNLESAKYINVKPAGEAINTGNLELLIYTSLFCGENIIISNGKQTKDIISKQKGYTNPKKILEEALKKWDYEPDSIKTPRISGMIKENQAALSIIKENSETKTSIRNYYEFNLSPGKAIFIATYNGSFSNPQPFSREPINVNTALFSNAEDIAKEVYEAINQEIVVSVAAVYGNNISIINKNQN